MKLAIIGDFDSEKKSHYATNQALQHSADYLGIDLDALWIPTDSITVAFAKITTSFDCYLIAPGGEYRDVNAVIDIIDYAKANDKPTLGTCAGFQMMVLAYAKKALGISNAGHAEYEPDAPNIIISPLSCNIKGSELIVDLIDEDALVYEIYGCDKIAVNYYCSYGINPAYQQRIHNSGFKIVGSDDTGEARILELNTHPFFIATLFVPQINSTPQHPNKLITAFLKAGLNNCLAK